MKTPPIFHVRTHPVWQAMLICFHPAPALEIVFDLNVTEHLPAVLQTRYEPISPQDWKTATSLQQIGLLVYLQQENVPITTFELQLCVFTAQCFPRTETFLFWHTLPELFFSHEIHPTRTFRHRTVWNSVMDCFSVHSALHFAMEFDLDKPFRTHALQRIIGSFIEDDWKEATSEGALGSLVFMYESGFPISMNMFSKCLQEALRLNQLEIVILFTFPRFKFVRNNTHGTSIVSIPVPKLDDSIIQDHWHTVTYLLNTIAPLRKWHFQRMFHNIHQVIDHLIEHNNTKYIHLLFPRWLQINDFSVFQITIHYNRPELIAFFHQHMSPILRQTPCPSHLWEYICMHQRFECLQHLLAFQMTPVDWGIKYVDLAFIHGAVRIVAHLKQHLFPQWAPTERTVVQMCEQGHTSALRKFVPRSFPLSQETLLAAVRSQVYSLVYKLLQRKHDWDFSQHLIQEAAQTGNDSVFMIIFTRGHYTNIPHEVIDQLFEHNMLKSLKILAQAGHAHIYNIDRLLQVCRQAQPDMLEELLKYIRLTKQEFHDASVLLLNSNANLDNRCKCRNMLYHATVEHVEGQDIIHFGNSLPFIYEAS